MVRPLVAKAAVASRVVADCARTLWAVGAMSDDAESEKPHRVLYSHGAKTIGRVLPTRAAAEVFARDKKNAVITLASAPVAPSGVDTTLINNAQGHIGKTTLCACCGVRKCLRSDGLCRDCQYGLVLGGPKVKARNRGDRS